MSAPFDPDGALAEEVLNAPTFSLPTQPPAPAEEPVPAETVYTPEEDYIPEFDPRWRDPFDGLLFLGHLEKTFPFWGHKFHLVTPSSAERLNISLLTKPYDGTIGWEFAYSCALVAAYLIKVDDQDLPQPITNDVKDTAMEQRWQWVLNNLRKPVIDALFEQCAILDGEVRGALEAMGKALG
jgi:hypothetical protein